MWLATEVLGISADSRSWYTISVSGQKFGRGAGALALCEGQEQGLDNNAATHREGLVVDHGIGWFSRHACHLHLNSCPVMCPMP
jgi:hypothetical protein